MHVAAGSARGIQHGHQLVETREASRISGAHQQAVGASIRSHRHAPASFRSRLALYRLGKQPIDGRRDIDR